MSPAPISGTGDVGVRVLLGSFDRDADPPDPLHLLVRRFRTGEPAAMQVVIGIAAGLPELMEGLGSGRMVPVAVPGHDGTITEGMRALESRLRAANGQLATDELVLARRVIVPEAKRRQERDASAELGSLQWIAGGGLDGIQTVVLLDDVLASGGTLRACAAAMRRDGWRGDVTAVVVAQAICAGGTSGPTPPMGRIRDAT